MARSKWQLLIGMGLLVLSAAIYSLHYLIFRDVHHIFLYGIGDLAFVFIEVSLVSLVIHQLLRWNEYRNRLEKLNMVIGTFFGEVGTKLLAFFSDHDPDIGDIKKELVVSEEWSNADFLAVSRKLTAYDYALESEQMDLNIVRRFLNSKADFLLRLLENPNLVEHEAFTNLLQAVFHIHDELTARDNLGALPPDDKAHLAMDIERGYSLLVQEWLAHMKHLKLNHPYLFAFAMRSNPFDEHACPIVGVQVQAR